MKRSVAVTPGMDKGPSEKMILTCHHYWLIEKAMGPTSKGECKYCGTSKDFSNIVPDLRWDMGVFDKPGSGLPVINEVDKEAVLVN